MDEKRWFNELRLMKKGGVLLPVEHLTRLLPGVAHLVDDVDAVDDYTRSA